MNESELNSKIHSIVFNEVNQNIAKLITVRYKSSLSYKKDSLAHNLVVNKELKKIVHKQIRIKSEDYASYEKIQFYLPYC